jgi:hypothetical protein
MSVQYQQKKTLSTALYCVSFILYRMVSCIAHIKKNKHHIPISVDCWCSLLLSAKFHHTDWRVNVVYSLLMEYTKDQWELSKDRSPVTMNWKQWKWELYLPVQTWNALDEISFQLCNFNQHQHSWIWMLSLHYCDMTTWFIRRQHLSRHISNTWSTGRQGICMNQYKNCWKP